MLIAVTFLAILIINIVIGFIQTHINPDALKPESYPEKNVINVVYGILIAPIFETLVTQKWLYNLFLDLSKNIFLAIILSAIIFGALHYYSSFTIVRAFFCGLILNGCYVISLAKSEKTAFWNTAIVHGIWNTFAAIIAYFNL